mgnify:CR=1 FL=1
MTHENVTFNSNGTLSTIPNHPLLWRGDLSEGRQEDDIFYLPNIALLVSNVGFYTGNKSLDCSKCSLFMSLYKAMQNMEKTMSLF